MKAVVSIPGASLSMAPALSLLAAHRGPEAIYKNMANRDMVK
ncbi:hypothetical protein QY97_03585 [Bacillus thermotolerans]|nr:hypothetical protein QY97_03585 [Bacillus thermotolerans]